MAFEIYECEIRYGRAIIPEFPPNGDAFSHNGRTVRCGISFTGRFWKCEEVEGPERYTFSRATAENWINGGSPKLSTIQQISGSPGITIPSTKTVSPGDSKAVEE